MDLDIYFMLWVKTQLYFVAKLFPFWPPRPLLVGSCVLLICTITAFFLAHFLPFWHRKMLQAHPVLFLKGP